jgi:predicted extracellular nuclease
MNTLKFGLAALLLAASGFAAAQQSSVKREQVIEGQVSGVLQPGMFWVQQLGSNKVLVYASAEQARNVRMGDQVKVRGTVPRDWVKLAAHELNAQAIQTLR